MADVNEHEIAAFSELVSEHRSRLFGYIYAMLHNMSDAEDVYQQTTLLLWEKFDEYQAGSDFGSWALKTAYYNVKNFQRSQSRRRALFSESVMEKVADSYASVDSEVAKERAAALVTCVKRLPVEHQQVLRLRYAENKAVKEIADSQGKSEAAMSMILGRLRKALYRCINFQMAAS